VSLILLIDDDDAIRNGVRIALEGAGFRVADSDTAQGGLQLARELKPDLILCDIRLPDMSGLTVVETLHSQPDLSDIPVILLTGETRAVDIRLGMETGAQDYLCKPVVVGDLLRAVTKRCEMAARAKRRTQERLSEHTVALGRLLGHEIRTPLGVIGPAAELLEQYHAEADSEGFRSVMDYLKEGAERLTSVVNRLELYSHLMKTQTAPGTRSKPWDGPPARQVITNDSLALARNWSRSADLHLELEDVHPCMEVDLFRVCIRELLDNAFKFSPPGSPVRLGLLTSDGCIRFECVDGGPGMTAEQIRRIEAFQQFHRDTQEQQGLGLGLVLVQLITQRSGAQLNLGHLDSGGFQAAVSWPNRPDQSAG
jgi:CheY-like chemotaxis protein